MATPVLELAWRKRQERRARKDSEAGALLHVRNDLVDHLASCALMTLGQKANDTQSTFVVACLGDKKSYLAFGIPVDKRDQLAQNFGLGSKDEIRWVTSGGEANLHGEMAIIRYLKKEKLVAEKANLGKSLTVVCVGKPVCADCCGFMTKYNIVHGTACGGGSNQGWRHPFSEAVFRGEERIDFTYQKSSKFVESASHTVPNPKLIKPPEKKIREAKGDE